MAWQKLEQEFRWLRRRHRRRWYWQIVLYINGGHVLLLDSSSWVALEKTVIGRKKWKMMRPIKCHFRLFCNLIWSVLGGGEISSFCMDEPRHRWWYTIEPSALKLAVESDRAQLQKYGTLRLQPKKRKRIFFKSRPQYGASAAAAAALLNPISLGATFSGPA